MSEETDELISGSIEVLKLNASLEQWKQLITHIGGMAVGSRGVPLELSLEGHQLSLDISTSIDSGREYITPRTATNFFFNGYNRPKASSLPSSSLNQVARVVEQTNPTAVSRDEKGNLIHVTREAYEELVAELEKRTTSPKPITGKYTVDFLIQLKYSLPPLSPSTRE